MDRHRVRARQSFRFCEQRVSFARHDQDSMAINSWRSRRRQLYRLRQAAERRIEFALNKRGWVTSLVPTSSSTRRSGKRGCNFAIAAGSSAAPKKGPAPRRSRPECRRAAPSFRSRRTGTRLRCVARAATVSPKAVSAHRAAGARTAARQSTLRACGYSWSAPVGR